MTRYRLLPGARREYLEAVRFYRDEVDDRELGRDFIVKFRQRVERIQQLPGSGSLVTGLSVPFEVRRAKLERFPYYLFFNLHNEEIVVLAVAHKRRRPGYFSERLDDV